MKPEWKTCKTCSQGNSGRKCPEEECLGFTKEGDVSSLDDCWHPVGSLMVIDEREEG